MSSLANLGLQSDIQEYNAGTIFDAKGIYSLQDIWDAIHHVAIENPMLSIRSWLDAGVRVKKIRNAFENYAHEPNLKNAQKLQDVLNNYGLYDKVKQAVENRAILHQQKANNFSSSMSL